MRQLTTLTRRLAYPAALALVTAVATPQAASAEGTEKAQGAGTTGAGETLKLTRKEAEGWTLRPVYSQGGEQVGKLAAVALKKDGSIKHIRVTSDGQVDAQDGVTIPADQFEVQGERISLEVSQSEFEEKASTSG